MVEWNTQQAYRATKINLLKLREKGKIIAIGRPNQPMRIKSQTLEFDSNGKAVVNQHPKITKEKTSYNAYYYDNMVKLLEANGNCIVHARTKEKIIGTSTLEHKRIKIDKRAIHLNRMPRGTFERVKNAVTQVITQKYEKGKLTVSIETVPSRKTNQWKTFFPKPREHKTPNQFNPYR